MNLINFINKPVTCQATKYKKQKKNLFGGGGGGVLRSKTKDVKLYKWVHGNFR